MKIVANGDSQTFGDGLSDRGTAARDWPSAQPWNNEIAQANRQYALANSWPAQLARKQGWDYVNLARSGGSNDRMVRTTLQHLTKHSTRDTVVIIGWTDPLRREVHVDSEIGNRNGEITGYKGFWLGGENQHDEFWTKQGTKWAANYRRYGWDLIESHVRFYSQVLLMTAYLKNNKIPYLYFNAIGDPENWSNSLEEGSYASSMTKDLYKQIDWNDFVSINNSTDNIVYDKLREYHDETMHLTLTGHDVFSELIKQELIQRGTI